MNEQVGDIGLILKDIGTVEDVALKQKKTFFSGVAALTVSTIFVKIIGLLYKIPMMQLLGAEGMGYFNSAYEIYVLFYVISTSGLPVALSKMVSEARASEKNILGRKIFRVSMIIFFIVGTLGTALMAIFAKEFSSYIKNDAAYYCILAISPTVLFIGISSSIRGYFQGCQNMMPTAISQIVETLGKLLLGLLFAYIALQRGYELPIVAAYAVLGLTLGIAFSMLYLIVFKMCERSSKEKDINDSAFSRLSVARNLINIAIPITISSAVISITRVIDMTMILRRLQDIGYESTVANAIYGSYSTLALPVFNLPPSLITGVALSLVPMLASSIEKKDTKNEKVVVLSSLKLCLLIAMPCSLAITVFSKQILQLLFANEYEAINICAPLLSALGISVFLSCLITETNAILQAYGKQGKPIISMIVGAVAKIIFSYVLIGIPSINVMGAPISTFICSLAVVFVNFYFIRKYSTSLDGIGKIFARTFVSSVISVCASMLIYTVLFKFLNVSGSLAFAIAVIFAVVSYIVISIKIGALDESDILMLPSGDKIHKVFLKLKLMQQK